MLKTMIVVMAVLVAISTVAQTPALPATFVPNADIQTFIDALPRNTVSDKPIPSVDVGGYHLAVNGVYPPKSVRQEANRHDTKVTEIYYILDGNATLVTGGTLPDPHPLSPGSTTFQGSRIEGGSSRRVSRGDVVIIPGRTPHWFSEQDGDLRYLIFRPDPEGRIALK